MPALLCRLQVFSRLLLEELRAHLQQSADENPAAASVCSTSSSGGSGSWSELAGALSASSATPLRLLEAQRQSDLHLLRFEPSTASASSAAAAAAAAAAGSRPQHQQPESAAEFSRSSGIRADDLLLLVGRPAAAGAAGAAPGLPPAAVALAAVESLHQQHQSERRQQQGLQGRHKQLLLTARVSLKSGAGGAARLLLQQQLTPGTSWQAVRLMSLTPHLRQLQALVAAQRLPPLLLAELLSPGTTSASRGSGSAGTQQQQQLAAVQPPLPAPMLRQLQQQYNSSQQASIAAAAAGYQPASSAAAAAAAAQGALAAAPAASSRGQRHVTLVQGPPGTGKTSAILGMLSVFLSANTPRGAGSGSSKAVSAGQAPARSKQPLPPSGAAAGRPAVVINPAVRVLLCAQSNAAVDELCTRLASRGVVGRCAVG